MRGLAAGALVGLVGCAHYAVQPSIDAEHARVADCLALYTQIDADVLAADASDGGSARISGFPYLRVNRFYASYADDLQPQQAKAWVAALRQLDQTAREAELSNVYSVDLAEAVLPRLNLCGSVLVREQALSPSHLPVLRKAAKVPDDYSTLARALGMYPLALPFLHSGIHGYQDGVRDDFAVPNTALRAQGQWRMWQPLVAAGVDAAAGDVRTGVALLGAAVRDELGVPQLHSPDGQRLLAIHAPTFLIDTRGDFDQPGQPQWHADSLAFVQQPSVYMHISYTRLGTQVLTQLNYQIWFSQRPANSVLDPYSGVLDGVIWRVTLDARGWPLVHDTVHPCGCFHMYFPVQRASTPVITEAWQEPLLLPQGQTPWWRVAVVIGSGDHAVRRVLPYSVAELWAPDEPTALLALPYQDLLNLLVLGETPGQTRSLFRADGLIPQTARLERFWLWPSGVYNPGAMRQNGRHATAFMGRAHFDDARGLEALYSDTSVSQQVLAQ